MNANPSDYIAGWNTPDDWARVRKTLIEHPTPEGWGAAYEDFFWQRLELRYLGPIRILQYNGTFRGEGFSIAAIQCTLVEFIESTVRGLTYRYLRRGESLGPFEYSSSADLFEQFLTTRPPFNGQFDRLLAHDFYLNVRCALIHEARTKNRWRIWAKDPQGRIVDSVSRILFRDDFQDALLHFVAAFKTNLIADHTLQEAFIRKFDSLCR